MKITFTINSQRNYYYCTREKLKLRCCAIQEETSKINRIENEQEEEKLEHFPKTFAAAAAQLCCSHPF